ncbi:AIS_collapsed_G0025440.mRNA.1.CDS.1 [Saccharomyces cerevisiae]|nr:AIS_collapsed_G0025440.mRNA.1.CDS.1 [Saccharomyces cerevisiae]
MSAIPENANVTVLNKNEKKARELIGKLGLKQIPGIIRVTFRKKDNQIYAIEKPEVFRSAGGNYVVFGEAKVDNFTQKLAAAQQQAQASGIMPSNEDVATKSPEDIKLTCKPPQKAVSTPQQKKMTKKVKLMPVT